MKTEYWMFLILLLTFIAGITAAETVDPTIRYFAAAIGLILAIIEINILYVWLRKTF